MLLTFAGHQRIGNPSSNCSLLASCSIDNTVIIWDVDKERIVKSLVGHRGIVKGLAWDPLGKFIVSQGDAPKKSGDAIIWRTSDFQSEKKIVEPFKYGFLLTFQTDCCRSVLPTPPLVLPWAVPRL